MGPFFALMLMPRAKGPIERERRQQMRGESEAISGDATDAHATRLKPCFTHREPSHVTLLNDPWPEDFSATRDRVARLMKAPELPPAAKRTRRKHHARTHSA
jgi:hypothetical protein